MILCILPTVLIYTSRIGGLSWEDDMLLKIMQDVLNVKLLEPVKHFLIYRSDSGTQFLWTDSDSTLSKPEEKPRHESLHNPLLGFLKVEIDNLEIQILLGKICIHHSPIKECK